jgi:hypothetical protein
VELNKNTMKRCSVCKNHKEKKEFSFNKNTRDGLSWMCKDCSNKRNKKYYGTKNGKLRVIFSSMKSRCYRKDDTHYKYYGARGIKIYDKWLKDVKSFVDWSIQNGFEMNLSIDRINNNDNYEPANCQWITIKANVNKRNIKTTDIEKQTRICRLCKKNKSFAEYSKNKSRFAGIMYICKSCDSNRKKERRNLE